MRKEDILPGDSLRLKADNAYGLGPLVVTVREIRPSRKGYKTPWIITDAKHGDAREWAFKPSDFAEREENDYRITGKLRDWS